MNPKAAGLGLAGVASLAWLVAYVLPPLFVTRRLRRPGIPARWSIPLPLALGTVAQGRWPGPGLAVLALLDGAVSAQGPAVGVFTIA